MSRHALWACLGVGVLFLAACAAGVNEQVHTVNSDGLVAGFWRGLWHGIISPVTFVVSLFSSKVGIYEVHNNGGWYNLGFLIGMFSFHGGKAARGVVRRRSRPAVFEAELRIRTDAGEPKIIHGAHTKITS